MATWSFTRASAKVLSHLIAGSKEDAETVTPIFKGMRARGLGDPILIVSDGAPGIIKASPWSSGDPAALPGESCFPRSARQRCLAHRMRNLAAKVPEDRWPELKARIQAAYQAPTRASARTRAEGVVADDEKALSSAIACFQDDLEACIAHHPPARFEQSTCWNVCSSRNAAA